MGKGKKKGGRDSHGDNREQSSGSSQRSNQQSLAGAASGQGRSQQGQPSGQGRSQQEQPSFASAASGQGKSQQGQQSFASAASGQGKSQQGQPSFASAASGQGKSQQEQPSFASAASGQGKSQQGQRSFAGAASGHSSGFSQGSSQQQQQSFAQASSGHDSSFTQGRAQHQGYDSSSSGRGRGDFRERGRGGMRGRGSGPYQGSSHHEQGAYDSRGRGNYGGQGRGTNQNFDDRRGRGRGQGRGRGSYESPRPNYQTDAPLTRVIADMEKLTIAPELKAKELLPPLRPGFGKRGRSIELVANHFKMNIGCNFIQHYDITFSPKIELKRVKRQIFEELRKDKEKKAPHIGIAFDGVSNAYASQIISKNNKEVTFDVPLTDNRGTRTFRVTFRHVKQLDVTPLRQFLLGKVRLQYTDTIQAIDVILRHLPSLNTTPVGRAFFPLQPANLFVSNDPRKQMPGKEISFGHKQSARHAMTTTTLNVDVTANIFYKAQPVLDFVREIKNLDLNNVSTDTFYPLKKVLSLLKVIVTYQNCKKRTYRINKNVFSTQDSRQLFFDLTTGENDQGKRTSVCEYFQNQYGITLQYPHLPCLHVGDEKRNIFLPMEVCTIAGGQSIKTPQDSDKIKLIQAIATTAPDRRRRIQATMDSSRLADDPIARQFNIGISSKMTEVNGRVIEAPSIKYGGQSTEKVENGAWNMRSHFVEPKRLSSWAICSQARFSEEALMSFAGAIRTVGSDLGMDISNVAKIDFFQNPSIESIIKVFKKIKQCIPTIQIIIVILRDRERGVYPNVKIVGDIKLGIMTQCILERNVTTSGAKNVFPKDKALLQNVLLKINSKIGGVNHQVNENQLAQLSKKWISSTIIFGADVTHPSPGDFSSPSVAAVVASMDQSYTRYVADVRAQKHRKEVISVLEEMVQGLLLRYRTIRGANPSAIMFYRDGVSEGQFYEVLEHEVRAVKRACRNLKINPEPKVTFLIVQKRHNTRFFCKNPNDETGKAKNIPPGTVVDTGVVHPLEFDFFLCSHFGIQGTSRPTHYHVLHDENDFTADEMQQFTHYLCHTYVRCPRSVSLPAPAYYAHLVAFRARYHLQQRRDDSLAAVTSVNNEPVEITDAQMAKMNREVTVTDGIKERMYYS